MNMYRIYGYMEIDEYVWHINGNQCNCIDYVWKLMDMYGYWWQSMKMYRNL